MSMSKKIFMSDLEVGQKISMQGLNYIVSHKENDKMYLRCLDLNFTTRISGFSGGIITLDDN